MSDIERAIAHINANQAALVDALKRFVAIPSVSTLAEHKPDMQAAAAFVAGELRSAGMEHVQIMPTGGHPVVYADWLHASGQPTVLIYGHYDVQPAVKTDGWATEPFVPEVRGDDLYGRGAADMKGPVLISIAALAALNKHGGGLPVNVKVLIEGEEEIGSPNLAAFMSANKDLLSADISLNNDVGMPAPMQPAITYALRGLAYFEVWVQGSQTDLHSGIFGGTVHNPAIVLAELIAGMHDADGRITLPGFYDSVLELDDEERKLLARVPYDEAQYLKNAGSPPALFGEAGFTPRERTGARPSLDVNGLYSGFIGEGSKTVLPAKAMAKISMRLVANQDPAEVGKQLKQYLAEHAPPTVTWEVRGKAGATPALAPRDSKWVQAADKALHAAFGVEPVYVREGGTIPVVADFKALLGIDSVLVGFSLPDAGMHGPDEKLHLPNYFRGIETFIRFFDALAS